MCLRRLGSMVGYLLSIADRDRRDQREKGAGYAQCVVYRMISPRVVGIRNTGGEGVVGSVRRIGGP